MADQDATDGTPGDAGSVTGAEVIDGDGIGNAGVAPGGADTAAGADGKLTPDIVAKLTKRMDDLNAHIMSQTDKRWAKLESALERLAEAKGHDSDRAAAGAGEEDARKVRSQLVEKYNKGELTGEEFLGLVENAFTQAEQRAVSKAKAEIDRLTNELTQVRARVEDYDPTYASKREQVQQVQQEFEQKYGVKLDRKAAIAIVDKFAKPAQPSRIPSPGGTSTSVRGGEQQGVLPAEQVAALEAAMGIKLTDAEKRELAKRGAK